jgi:hypothetical protein
VPSPNLTYLFFGTVEPPRPPISLDPFVHRFRAPHPTQGAFELEAAVSVDSGIFRAVISSPPSIPAEELTSTAVDLVQVAVDAASVLHGKVYRAQLLGLSWTNPQGQMERRNALAEVHRLGAQTISDERGLADLAFEVPALGRALGELRRAMDHRDSAHLHAYRAIEFCRQYFADEATERDASWTHLRETLRIERSVVTSIQGWAEAQRHGEFPSVLGAEIDRAIDVAIQIVDRFILHLRGDAGLAAVPYLGGPPATT